MTTYVSCVACHLVQREDELIHGRWCADCDSTSFSAATQSEYEFRVPEQISVRPVSTAELERQARAMIERLAREEA